MDRAAKFIALEDRWGTHNYHPLPVVLARGKGVYVWDVRGRRYFDMLSAYSSLNQGHCHPAIVAALRKQAGRLSLGSRAFHSELLGPFLERLCGLAGTERALPMNSGAEAVESAIKAMRLWGHKVKGIPDGAAEIVVAEGNFHGRTTTIVGFSSDPGSRLGFGPATPGFKTVPYGDSAALAAALGPNTAGVLLEPIQGEAGVRIPPPGYLKAVAEACRKAKVLFCLDEIQTGLGRTGRMFAWEHEGAKPDLMTLGKALSGGLYPVSAVVGSEAVLGLFTPGTHGSTYGGNPLACATALAAIDVLTREKLAEKAAELGVYFLERLGGLKHPSLKEVRGLGLLCAVEFRDPLAKEYCKRLMDRGVLAKDTHGTTVRFAPPLVITKVQLEAAFEAIRDALRDL
ncbi:MAG: ornithine--oxo-acid transaminase [Elusimicrobia bacterium]|nr:MAG: ornithine--oxo-acid transaminase [Elusimicrobiota bacterium]